MTRIDPDDWRPRGIPNLEPQAWRALRHTGSTSVVAGPGAGKTEFLAQRVAYLLETATCPAPYRILAISFKTDAASNLADRVHRRCPPELTRRFVSLTFDAFTKGLVDRFLNAIPAEWRPTPAYDVAFPSRRDVSYFLDITRLRAPQNWQGQIAGIDPGRFESQHVGSYRLPITREAPRSGLASAIDGWWQARLRGVPRSSLTFTNFNRLAELLLRSNSHIRRALRVTYPFVFVDEFQDTTYAQYDFLLSAFSEGSTTVTVVGDDKQKIMTWAGAKPDVFRVFEENFAATRIPLTFNFRSSPDLVHIQHVVALALDGEVVPGVSQTVRTVDGDVAQVALFRHNCRGQSSGPDADYRDIEFDIRNWRRSFQFHRDMFYDICAFICCVLNQRRAGNIPDDVTTGHVGHKLLVPYWDWPWFYYLCRVNDDAGFWADRTFCLAGSVFDALITCHWNRDIVDHCQDVVRTGLDACVASDATIGNNYWMRISRPRWIVLFQQFFRKLDSLLVRINSLLDRLLQQVTLSPCVAKRKPERRDRQKATDTGPSEPRKSADITMQTRPGKKLVDRQQQREKCDDDKQLRLFHEPALSATRFQ